MATAAKFILLISIFLAYLVPLDVDMTGNITAQLCEVWSVFNIFCTLVTMAAAAILIFLQPQKLPHTRKFDERNPIFFKSPLFCFHGNCGKACPTDSDSLAYLVPLDVDVVPIKFHQFLIGE